MENDDGVRVFYPEYGPVQALLGFALFYLLVDVATESLVSTVGTVAPDVDAGATTTWTAIALWAMFGLLVVTQAHRQVSVNPRRFSSADDRDAFLRENAPAEDAVLAWVALAVVGGVVAAWSWGAVPTLLPQLVGLLTAADVTALPPTVTVMFVLFFVAFGAASYSVDRLLVGGVRTAMVP